jgi:hypothetical protein
MNDYEPSLACCMPSVLHLFGTVVEIGHSKSVLHPGLQPCLEKLNASLSSVIIFTRSLRDPKSHDKCFEAHLQDS